MIIDVLRADLLPALAAANSIANPRGTLPILSHVLLRGGTATGLEVVANNMELELTQPVAAQCDDTEALTLPARKLLDIVKNLPDDATLRIKPGDTRATVTSGRARFQLSVLPATEFPRLSVDAPTARLTLPSAALKALLDKVSFAQAKNDVRFYLNGVLVQSTASALTAVATDGHRLAQAVRALSGADAPEALIPGATVAELRKLLPDSDAESEMCLSGQRLQVRLPNGGVLSSVLIDGKYPDYQRVIPRDVPHVATIDRDALRQALARVGVLSNEKYRGVRLAFTPGLLKLTAHNTEQEESAEELDIEYSGPDLGIGFNLQYVSEMLGAIETAAVQIALNDSNSSSIWRGMGCPDETFVIMPMRL